MQWIFSMVKPRGFHGHFLEEAPRGGDQAVAERPKGLFGSPLRWDPPGLRPPGADGFLSGRNWWWVGNSMVKTWGESWNSRVKTGENYLMWFLSNLFPIFPYEILLGSMMIHVFPIEMAAQELRIEFPNRSIVNEWIVNSSFQCHRNSEEFHAVARFPWNFQEHLRISTYGFLW